MSEKKFIFADKYSAMSKDTFKIINKTAVRDAITNKPKGQKIHDAFDGSWDLLTDIEIKEVRDFLKAEFNKMEIELDYTISLRT